MDQYFVKYYLAFLGIRGLNPIKNTTNKLISPWKKSTRKIFDFFTRKLKINPEYYAQSSDVISSIQKRSIALEEYSKKKHKQIHLCTPFSQTNSQRKQLFMDSPIQSEHSINIDTSPTNQNLRSNNKSCIQQYFNKNILYSILSWLYSLTIFIILLINPILYFIEVCKGNIEYLSICSFTFIYPVQYFLSINYFAKDHFDKHYFNWKKKPRMPGKNKFICVNQNNLILLFLFIVGIISLIISFVFLLIDDDYIFIDKLSRYTSTQRKIFLGIEIISWIYGRLLLILNLFTFFFIFCKHITELKEEEEFLKKSNWINYRGTKTISDICISIIIKKYELGESINALEFIFTGSTFLGGIGFASSWINYRKYGISSYLLILCISFVIIQTFFFIIIKKIGEVKQSMLASVHHPIFAAQWLMRTKERHKRSLDDNELLILFSDENSSSIDWIILNTILNEKWVDFSFFGISLNDSELIKRCFGLAGLIISVNQFSFNYLTDPSNV